jgi:hypothetical protein
MTKKATKKSDITKATKAFEKAVQKHVADYQKKVEKIIKKAEARKLAQLESKLGK